MRIFSSQLWWRGHPVSMAWAFSLCIRTPQDFPFEKSIFAALIYQVCDFSFFMLWFWFWLKCNTGTAYLDFQNARVPLNHLIGLENDGFRIVMYNFNHERFYICAMCVRLSRVCMEECIKYALKRKTFGKVRCWNHGGNTIKFSICANNLCDFFWQALHEHQAIRMKVRLICRAFKKMDRSRQIFPAFFSCLAQLQQIHILTVIVWLGLLFAPWNPFHIHLSRSHQWQGALSACRLGWRVSCAFLAAWRLSLVYTQWFVAFFVMFNWSTAPFCFDYGSFIV